MDDHDRNEGARGGAEDDECGRELPELGSAKKINPRPGGHVCKCSKHSRATLWFKDLEPHGSLCSNKRNIKGNLRYQLKTMAPSKHFEDNWICGACLHVAKLLETGKTEEEVFYEAEKDFTSQLIDILDLNALHEENLMKVAASLGRASRIYLKQVASSKRPTYQDLKTYDHASHTLPSNCIMQYLKSVTCFDLGVSSERNKKVRHLQKALESMCLVLSPKFISPSAACENMVLHSFSKSRFATDMHAATNASGGHTYISNLVESIKGESPAFPVGDIVVAFDNTQVIGKEYYVRAGPSHHVSVSTTVCVFQEKTTFDVQRNFKIPTILPVPSTNPTVLWSKFQNEATKWSSVHRHHRANFISERLEQVKLESSFQKGSLDEAEVQNLIFNANYEAAIMCSRVERFESSVKVTDMKNLPLNPNSAKTVENVLEQLLKWNDESDPSREWFSVYCDGVPYCIASKIIANRFICRSCNLAGLREDLEHHSCDKPAVEPKYKKILLRPGAGHIEMNLVRSVFAEFFDIYIKPVALMLGFVTPRSLDYCRCCGDHHKSWQILQIMFLAITDELLFKFGWENDFKEFTSAAFEDWRKNLSNPNLILAADFAFNILHPIFLYRAGIRQCNTEVSLAAMYKASCIFFGFNHPKYRELVTRELLLLVSMPTHASEFAKRMSFAKSKSTSGQGPDFLVEERNKAQKNWIFSNGTPTQAQWERASATLTYFEEMKDDVLKRLGLLQTPREKHIEFGQEYLLARRHFREMFVTMSPHELSTCSKEPTIVNPVFVDCVATSIKNMHPYKYIQSFLSGEKTVLCCVSSQDLSKLNLTDLLKASKKKLRLVPSYMKGDITAKLQNCSSIEDALEVLMDIDDIFNFLDYSFDPLSRFQDEGATTEMT